MRKKLRKEEECNFEIVDASNVDGQKGATVSTNYSSNSKFYPKIEIDKHYIVASEPGDLYQTHLSVEDSKHQIIGQAIYKALENTGLQNRTEQFVNYRLR